MVDTDTSGSASERSGQGVPKEVKIQELGEGVVGAYPNQGVLKTGSRHLFAPNRRLADLAWAPGGFRKQNVAVP